MAYKRFTLNDFGAIKKELDDMKKAPEKAIKALMGDVRKRVPGWISAEVVKVYGIKKADISNGAAGTVRVKGSNPKEAAIIYAGRMLTPTHFGMTPKAPGANAYTLKASILKGQKATLGKVKKLSKKQRAQLGKNFTKSGTRSSNSSPIMLMHTGNKQAGGTNYIPFQRKSQNRKDIKAIKTISLPQMVSSERTKDNISKAINEGLDKRLAHYMERYMNK